MPRSSNPVPTSRGALEYGRGTGVPHPIDVHVGTRVRMRRHLLGMNQTELADALGLTFQQVQKYEGGANRISASRLAATAEALGVPVSYFFDGLVPTDTERSAEEQRWHEQQQRGETLDLIRHYYAIADPRVRDQFLLMVIAIAKPASPA